MSANPAYEPGNNQNVSKQPINMATGAHSINMTEPQDQKYTAIKAVPNKGWGAFNETSNPNLRDKVIRIQFIRKVYLIVTTQLLFTFGFVCLFCFVEPIKNFAQSDTGLYLYIASYGIFVVLIIIFSMCSCTKGLRRTPWNYILLWSITLSMTYMLSMISAYHDTLSVMFAIAITMLITLGVTAFSMQTKYDFTNCWMVLLCMSWAMVGFGISMIIGWRFGMNLMTPLYGGLGALIMALFLAIDTQLIMGLNTKYKYSSEDYINAALQLYLDICIMFLYLLRMFRK